MSSLSPSIERAQFKHSVHLAIEFNVSRLTPRGVRRRFANAIRRAIAHAYLSGSVGQAVCEELWRASPNPERV